MIDYIAMSKDMGLHLASLNQVVKQNKRHSNVTRLREYLNNA